MIRLLKEWDAIERALEDGRQVLLARKGGLLDNDDGSGRFEPVYEDFFIYPTQLHQLQQIQDALKPSELPRNVPLAEAPPPPITHVSLRLFCRTVDTYRITDPARLKALDGEHIWKTSFLEKRFAWGNERGLTLLVVRAYKLASPVPLAVKPSFAGCKSWIEDADTEITTENLVPALSDEEFAKRRLSLRRLLS